MKRPNSPSPDAGPAGAPAGRGHPDPALHAVLQAWQPQATPPPRFQESVWARINQARAATPPTSMTDLARLFLQAFVAWIQTQLPRPALAGAYVVVLLALGAGLGWNQARQESARVREQLSTRYAHAVDPYLAHNLPPR